MRCSKISDSRLCLSSSYSRQKGTTLKRLLRLTFFAPLFSVALSIKDVAKVDFAMDNLVDERLTLSLSVAGDNGTSENICKSLLMIVGCSVGY